MYLILLLVGAFGFVLMSALGVSHGIGGHHVTAGHARVSFPHHGARAGHHGGGAAKAHTGRHSGSHDDSWKLLMAISPIDVFSMLLGAGAIGTILKAFLTNWQLATCAVIGGLLFTVGVIRPTMGFLMGFASKPSEGLEGEVSSVAEAVTRFDSNGQGVIKLILDEQVVQLLAHLDAAEIEKGVKVAKGEKGVVVSVNAARNSCIVSRELAPSESNTTP